MSARVRLGAVGAGWWATSNHFPIFAARDDVELVGVCGIGPELEAVREQFGFGMATTDYDELLDQDLDAVVISTPHDLHHPQAVAAIDRGLHVLVEKPVTLTADQGWDLADRVRERGVHFLAPYGWNYKPFTVEAKRLVAAGHLGEIQHVLCHMASPTRGLFAGDTNHIRSLWDSKTSGPEPSTWQSPARGGGYAHGQVTHSSALLFWLSELRAASVMAKVSTGGAAVDLFDAAVITFDGGALGSLSGAATLPDGNPYQVDIRIFGTEGVLLLDTERERCQPAPLRRNAVGSRHRTRRRRLRVHRAAEPVHRPHHRGEHREQLGRRRRGALGRADRRDAAQCRRGRRGDDRPRRTSVNEKEKTA